MNRFTERNTDSLSILISRSLSLTIAVLIQISQFRYLPSSDFVYLSLISILCGIIGQLDLGLINLISTGHLHSSRHKFFMDNEIQFLKHRISSSKGKLIWISTFWIIFSLVTSFVQYEHFQDVHKTSLLTSLCASFVIVLNAFGAITTRLLLTLGLSTEILRLQLISASIQYILFISRPSLGISLIGMSIYPISTIFRWINISRIESDSDFDTIHMANMETKLNWPLQIAQILGVATTLSAPFIAAFALTNLDASIIQLQIKIASLIVTLMASLYLTTQRNSAFNPSKNDLLFIAKISAGSILIGTISIVVLHFLHNFANINSNIPSTFSWVTLVLYVGVQPICISLYYRVMNLKKYVTLCFSAGINFLFNIFLIAIFVDDVNKYFPTIFISTILSSLPLIYSFRVSN